ncbi:hypothetical protein GQX74_007931 [Glossina fuscipes]|nr:hypothetical protein GQX74_007931 [Glossina fuscipes]
MTDTLLKTPIIAGNEDIGWLFYGRICALYVYSDRMFVNENALPFNQTQLLKCQHRLDVSLIGIDANTKKTNCQSNRMEAICTPEYYEKNASGSYLADSVENCSVFSVQNAAVEVDAMETRIKNKKNKNK